MAMPVPYMSAMMSEPDRDGDDDAACGTRCILSRPRSCRLRDTVIGAAAASAAASHAANCYLAAVFHLHVFASVIANQDICTAPYSV